MKQFYFFLSMILLGSFSREDDFISDLKQKSENYFSKYKRAKLEVIFNQPKYAIGDTVHFKINYVSAANLKPIIERQIVHLLWFDQLGKKAMTQWATISNGSANCKMAIPKDFSEGNYLVVAFTDWMKNFDQSLFFKQKFVVAGKYAIHDIQPTDSILFYPEGGSLVANIENNLALVYRGKEKVNYISIKENDKEIGLLSVLRDSVNVFKFTPKNNATYVAEIVTTSKLKKFLIPEVKTSGITLSAIIDSSIKIIAEASEIQPKEKYYLAIFNSKGLIYQTNVDFNNNQKNTTLLPSNLPEGIAQVILSDSKYNLIANRVIYIGNISVKKVKIENLQNTYATRQSVKLQLFNEEGKNIKGNFYCRIINDDLLHSSDINGINYLTFQSDISNTFNFKSKHINASSVNTYLITQSCPWFDWKKIISDDKTPMMFKPEEYLKISGQASSAETKKPVSDSTLIMLFFEKSLKGYETYTSSKGIFSFLFFPVVTQPDRFFYTASFHDNDIDNVSVKLYDLDSMITFSAAPFSIDKTVIDSYAVYSVQRNTIDNSYSFFTNSKVQNDSVEDRNKYIEDKLMGADMNVSLADYLQMPTMPEVVKEILKAVEYRQINGRHVVRMYTTSSKKPTNHTGPLYVIDGVLTKDASHFISLKPSDIVSIKLVRDVRKLITFGKIAANGIILVKTKKGNSVVQENHMIDFSGMLPTSNFNSNTNSLQLPDLRSCLYWCAENTSCDEIDFTTSDDVGNFKLEVYGFTEDGNSIYSEFPFTVSFKN